MRCCLKAHAIFVKYFLNFQTHIQKLIIIYFFPLDIQIIPDSSIKSIYLYTFKAFKKLLLTCSHSWKNEIPVIRSWMRERYSGNIQSENERVKKSVGGVYMESLARIRSVIFRGKGRGRFTAPCMGYLAAHATLEPSISLEIYGFWLQRLFVTYTHTHYTPQYHVLMCSPWLYIFCVSVYMHWIVLCAHLCQYSSNCVVLVPPVAMARCYPRGSYAQFALMHRALI